MTLTKRLVPPAPPLSEQFERARGAAELVRKLQGRIPEKRATLERTPQGEAVDRVHAVKLRTTPVAWGIPFDEIVFARWATHFINQRMMMPWDDSLTDTNTYISEARNNLHQFFVTKSKLDWFVMLDSDVIPPPDFVDRLLVHNLPMVGGWYKKKCDGTPPCVYDFERTDGNAIAWWRGRKEPGTGLEKVDGAGAGCWLMHRSVAEKLGERPYNPHVLSEDFLLCRLLADKGIDVYIDWSINCAHAGVSLA